MKVNQDITLEMLDKFKNETMLNDEIKNKIYDDLSDYIEYSYKIIPMFNITLYIQTKEYNCIYSKYNDYLDICCEKEGVFIFPSSYDDSRYVKIDNTYKKNRKVPVFVKKIIDELLKFKLIKEENNE